MDFTALELGLRNRQLLQVKCFLKIQIETFRFFLSEELSHVPLPEQSLTLEKFFMHDWQNVVNKISSVATIQMSGDYPSKIFAILLFRSLIHSCNHLILIVSSLTADSGDQGYVFGQDQIRSSSSSSMTSSSVMASSIAGSDDNQLAVIREKIMVLLIKQINSMKQNLLRIHRSELNLGIQEFEPTAAAMGTGESEDSDFFSGLDLENVSEITKFSAKDRRFQELFERCLRQDSIPLLVCLVKKCSGDAGLSWDSLVEMIVNHAAMKIKYEDLSQDEKIEQIQQYLAQTGHPIQELLFQLFIQTCDSGIRQKLLQWFGRDPERWLSRSGLPDHLRIMSVIDLYIFSQRPQISNDAEQLEIAIQWVHRPSTVLATSFLLPVLNEISKHHTDLFNDWQRLQSDLYSAETLRPFRSHFFVQEDFATFVTEEALWRYSIDNNHRDFLVNWIRNQTVSMPYCLEIGAKDEETSKRMLGYLLNNAPATIQTEALTALVFNPYFFNRQKLSDLAKEFFTFEEFLRLLGQQTDIVSLAKPAQLIDALLDKVIPIAGLVRFCVQNELFEFLYLLYKHGAIPETVEFNPGHPESEATLRFLRGLCSSMEDLAEKKRIFEKSIFILRFLRGGHEPSSDQSSFSANVHFLVKETCCKSVDMDLVLLTVSATETETLVDFAGQIPSDLARQFFNNLSSKYPLINRAFAVTGGPEEESGWPRKSDSCDLYSFLQQAIPSLNISKLFQWQIDKQPEELPHFSQRKLTELYGLKAHLTPSFYLKNCRPIEAFLKSFGNLDVGARRESSTINEKAAIKAVKKASSIGYGAIKSDSVVVSCLLFQRLVRGYMSPSHTGNRKSAISDTLRKSVVAECEKFRLHLAVGRLIIEYAADFLHLQNVQLQQDALAVLLRKSHFNSDRNCTQKLLDLATVGMERKYGQPGSSKFGGALSKTTSLRRRSTTVKLYSLYIEPPLEIVADQSLSGILASCNLLIECFDWRAIFMFANHYSLPRPMNFFHKCTAEDNWLALVIFAQIYEIPKDELQELLNSAGGGGFNNPCIGEHLSKAFQSSRQVVTLSDGDAKILRSKQMPGSARNVLYSKLFKEKKSPPMSSPSSPPTDTTTETESKTGIALSPPLSESDSPESFMYASSLYSKFSAGDQDSSAFPILFEHQLTPATASKDFLQLVLDIYRNCAGYASRTGTPIETSFQVNLLYASVSLSNPILALLASSLERNRNQDSAELVPRRSDESTTNTASTFDFERFKFPAFGCWLIANVTDPDSKQAYIDWYNAANPNRKNGDSMADCYVNWTPERLLRLINVLTARQAQNFSLVLRGLKIFEINLPILFALLDFLIGFLVKKDYYQTGDLLMKFQSLMLEYNEDEFLQSNTRIPTDPDGSESNCDSLWSTADFYSKSWIEKCSLTIVTNSLLIAKPFELSILLSHYNFVRIQDSFTTADVPDIRRFYLFSQCLNKVPHFTLPIADLLQIVDGDETAESRYGDVLRGLIFALQESGHFDAAGNLINSLSPAASNVNEFIINEWMLKAKQAESSATIDGVDISFWEDCWLQVTKLDPSMHSALRVMERFLQQLDDGQILIKCFVLLKCLHAVETILLDSTVDKESAITMMESSPIRNSAECRHAVMDDTVSTVCSSDGISPDSNDCLIQNYFDFEDTLWKSIVECEFHIQNTASGAGNQESKAMAWQKLWKDIVEYFNSSVITSTILSRLQERRPSQSKRQSLAPLDPNMQPALDKVIQNLLDHFCYHKAVEVSQLFNHIHDDFEIIEACDQTARHQLKDVSDAPLSVQLRLKNSDQVVQTARNISAFSYLNVEQRKTFAMLETLASFATIGQKFCQYILLHYKMACLLHRSYAELKDSNRSASDMLQMLLASSESATAASVGDTPFGDDQSVDQPPDAVSIQITGSQHQDIDRYRETIGCAKEFLQIVGRVDNRLDSEEKIIDLLAEFVCDSVRNIVAQQFNLDIGPEIELDRGQLEFYGSRFSALIRLLRQPSALGHKLIEMCKKSRMTFEANWEQHHHPKLSPTMELAHEALPEENQDDPTIYATEQLPFMIAKRQHYVQLVELYIRAHECFTAQCDVSGIALVLRRTRLLIAKELQPARFFHLILRLLTGIGRYSEMTYCFDLFRECDRFEMILSKRVQRTPQLRIALLNYLKQAEHIDELLPLVAIRFFLYRETADQHRCRAERLLREFNFGSSLPTANREPGGTGRSSLPKRISSTSLNETQFLSSGQSSASSMLMMSHPSTSTSFRISQLNSSKGQLGVIMLEYQEAEANYLKANSYSLADLCSRQAQLIALQLFYLNQVKMNADLSVSNSGAIPVVVNLDGGQVKEFINQCNHFYEALIVSKAYPEINIEWADPFFQNAILNNNHIYSHHFLESNQITHGFLEKLVKRYEIMTAKSFRPQTSSVAISKLSSSPTATSLARFSEVELQKIYLTLEQFFERILCDTETVPPLELRQRYELAQRLRSQKILGRLVHDWQNENFAYLLDTIK